MFSSATDMWGTPLDLFDRYNQEFGFTVDGAADASTTLLHRWMGPGSSDPDALTCSWQGARVWLNPPYSRCAEFLAKAVNEWADNDVPTCILIPARTDTRYFHNYIFDRGAATWHPWVDRVDFIKGRLKFTAEGKGAANSAPFPSMVIVLKGF